MSESRELTVEAMDAKMGGKAPEVPPVPAPEPKTTPGDGKPGGESEVETPPEAPVTPPIVKEGEEPKPTDDKGKSGEPEEQDPRAGKEGTPKGVQKRIDKAVKKQSAAEKRAVFAEGEAKALKEQLDKVNEQPLPELVAPDPDDYDDHDKYTDALVDHKVAVRDRETDAKAKELEKVNTEDPKPEPLELTEEQEETREAMVDSLGEMREKYPDFDDVAFGRDAEGKHTFPVTFEMKEGLESSESRMEILYYLGQNPAEAHAIADLPPTKQVMAIGRLDSKLKGLTVNTKNTKKMPGAPAPINPVGGTGTSQTVDMDNLSNDDWMKKRNQDTGEGQRRK